MVVTCCDLTMVYGRYIYITDTTIVFVGFINHKPQFSYTMGFYLWSQANITGATGGILQEVLEHPCLPRGSNSTELLIGDADAQADAAAAGANAFPPLSATWHGKGQYDAWMTLRMIFIQFNLGKTIINHPPNHHKQVI